MLLWLLWFLCHILQGFFTCSRLNVVEKKEREWEDRWEKGMEVRKRWNTLLDD